MLIWNDEAWHFKRSCNFWPSFYLVLCWSHWQKHEKLTLFVRWAKNAQNVFWLSKDTLQCSLSAIVQSNDRDSSLTSTNSCSGWKIIWLVAFFISGRSHRTTVLYAMFTLSSVKSYKNAKRGQLHCRWVIVEVLLKRSPPCAPPYTES